MKVYVAGRFKKKDEIRRIYRLLEAQGHSITYKWTEQDSIVPLHEHREKAMRYLAEYIAGILSAEVFILLAEYEPDARGCHVELGFALAEAHRRPLPIYVVYEKENPSLFYVHPKVRLVKTFQEVVAELERVSV